MEISRPMKRNQTARNDFQHQLKKLALNRLYKGLALIIVSFSLIACSDPEENADEILVIEGRWYSEAQLELGERVYNNNCISCHLENAQGTLEWRKTINGVYPPPPLNGTAHAWHHSIDVLMASINEGGVPFGGVMPAFKNSLTEDQKLSVIAYFQNFWSKEIYNRWEKMNSNH